MLHIGYIMDGNRRYSKLLQKKQPQTYRKSIETTKKIIKFQIKEKIPFATLYTLSIQNYKNRTKQEIAAIFETLNKTFQNKKILQILRINKIKIELIGDLTNLKPSEKETIKNIKKNIKEKIGTLKNPNLTINLAFNYGGQEEIISAINKILKLKIEKIKTKELKKYLWTKNTPPPELIIRSGGMKRLSNFLLWDSAYTEIYFSDKLWPEINITDLKQIKNWFEKQKRNFGK